MRAQHGHHLGQPEAGLLLNIAQTEQGGHDEQTHDRQALWSKVHVRES
jgi:hypothetical protein